MKNFRIIVVLIFLLSTCTSYSFADEPYDRFNKDSNVASELDMNSDGKIDVWITIDINKKVLIKDTTKTILEKTTTDFNEFFECSSIDMDNDGIRELVIITMSKDKTTMYLKIYSLDQGNLMLKSETSNKLNNEIINTSYIVSSDINKNKLKELIIVYRDVKSNLINRWDAYEFVSAKLTKIISENLKTQNIIQIKIDNVGNVIKKRVFFNTGSITPNEYSNMYYTYLNSKLEFVNKDENKKYYSDVDEKTLEALFKKVGVEEAVPFEILKAIAKTESKARQFEFGEPIVSFDNGIGIMQVTPIDQNQKISYLTGEEANIDVDRLFYDTEYNIKIGARILQEKWRMAFGGITPKVSDMNPQVIENWYFSIMAYNGYVLQNMPKVVWGNAYQEKVIDFIPRFNKSNFSYESIFVHGINENGLPIIKTYELQGESQITENTNSEIKVGESLKAFVDCTMRSTPEIADNIIGKLYKDARVQVLEKAGTSNGYIWYKVKRLDDGVEGYVVGMFLRYLFDDIAALTWGRSEIIAIDQFGIIDSAIEKSFRPTAYITRGEFCKYIVKALKLEIGEFKGIFPDITQNNPNAIYIEAASKAGIINGIPKADKFVFDENGMITREQIAAMIMRVHRNNYLNIADVSLDNVMFSDIKEVGSWALEDVKGIASLRIMQGSSGKFMPKANTSRQEAASLIYRIFNLIKING